MTTNKELARAIDPKKKPSFSPNLHNFVRAWGRRYPEHITPQVWQSNDDKWLYLGYIDPGVSATSTKGFVGVRLPRVLCNGASVLSHEGGWYSNLGPGNMTHVADFWERYLQIGRCAIDTKHQQFFIGDDGRYVMHGKIRTCTWCGAQHKLRIEKKVTTTLIEHYDPITTKEAA